MAIRLSQERARRLGTWVWNAALGVGAATILTGAGLSWLRRAKVRGLKAEPDPARDYQGALLRLAELEALDDDRINPVCRSRGLLHGQKTEHAVILIHGLTNCPQQWAQFGEQLYARGINVLLPRMPRHGFADRLTTEVGKLHAEELREFGDRMVDIAAGLGERVTIVGLSAGGIVAAWAAQYRAELSRAVLIAPSFGFYTYGERMQLLFMNLVLTLPDIATQHFINGDRAMPYAYVGWSSHALGEVLRLGMATARAALTTRPATQHLILVTNANDTAVNNGLARQIMTLWQSRGLRRVEYYEFDKGLRLEHDLIDPNNPLQRIDVVYPVIQDLIVREAPEPTLSS
jgi:pimeloyl-ACP methyl ester carboxylesterase